MPQKLLALLGAQIANNPVAFIVKAGRFFYTSTAGIISLAWYMSWRNERVSTGDKTIPIPGVSKLPKLGKPDRPDPALPSTADIARGNAGSSSIPGSIPSTPFDPNSIASGPGGRLAPDGGQIMQFDGKWVASWIVPILKFARAHGWRGSVASGWRSYADQVRIYNSGVRPAARPGTSNHEGAKFPRGAVDVTQAAQLSAVLSRTQYRTVLVWAGAKDPVHFSHPHNGGY